MAKADAHRNSGAAFPARIVGLVRYGALALGLASGIPPLAAQELSPAAPPAGAAPSGAAPGGGATTAPAGGGTAAPETGLAPLVGGATTPAPAPTAPAWLIVPSLGLEEEFNDNVRLVSKGREADLSSIISPGLYVTGDTPRLQTTLSYTPQAIEHAQATDQDQILQNLTGTGTLTAVPGLLFLDAHAAMTNIDRAGGLGYANQVQIPTSLSTQTTAYSLSPYLQFHFGDTGNSEVRYLAAQTIFSGNTGPIASSATGTTLGSLSNSTEQEASAVFTTGEAFGRLQSTASAAYIDNTGSNAAASRETVVNVQNTYQVSGPFFAIAGGGYDHETFVQSNSGNTNGPDWSLGGRFQPREDRTVTLTYGRSQGQIGFAGDVRYAVTQLTTVTASYSQSTTTEQQQLLQNLGGLTPAAPGTTVTSAGTTVINTSATQQIGGLTITPVTGLPATLQNPNLALQNSVLHSNILQVTILLQPDERNRYAVSFDRTVNTALSSGGLSQTSDGGLVTYNRDMSPSTNGVLSAGYTQTNSSAVAITAGTRTAVITLNAGVTYNITDTLAAAANYSLNRQRGGTTGPVMDDIVIVSLRKQF